MRYSIPRIVVVSALIAAPVFAQVAFTPSAFAQTAAKDARHICRDLNLGSVALQDCANRLESATSDTDRARIVKEYNGAIGAASPPDTPVVVSATKITSHRGAMKASTSGAQNTAIPVSPQTNAIAGKAQTKAGPKPTTPARSQAGSTTNSTSP